MNDFRWKLWFFISRMKFFIFIDIFILIFGFIFILFSYLIGVSCFRGIILASIGTSLIAAFVVYTFEIFRDFFKEDLTNKIFNVLLNAGINFVYKKRDIDRYDILMDSAKEKIDVLGYSLRSFFQSNKEKLIEMSDSRKSIMIRILVVDPESNFSKNRERVEDEASGTYLNSITTMSTFLSGKSNIELRKIDAPIGTMIYRIDDIIFVGPHLYKRGSISTVTL